MADQKSIEIVQQSSAADGKTSTSNLERPQFDAVSEESPNDAGVSAPLNYDAANESNDKKGKNGKNEEATYVPSNSNMDASLSSINLRQKVDELLDQLETERLKSHYETHAPWKFDIVSLLGINEFYEADDRSEKIQACIGIFGRFLKYMIPPIIILLLIIANASRKERTSMDGICQVSSYLTENATYSDSSTIDVNANSNSTSVFGDCFDSDNNGLSTKEAASQGWKIVLSLIPFVCVFQGVLGYDLSSRYVAPFTLLVTIYLGMVYFEDEGWWEISHDFGGTTQGNAIEVSGLVFLTIVDRVAWTIFEYAFNVFTAFFFLRVLEYWGVVDQMRIEFEEMCPTNARKVTLILFCFAVMIAVVAPGGSNFLIAGAIMIEINHSMYDPGEERDNYDINVGTICLFGNGLTSAFNLVGVCVIAIASDIMELAEQVNDNICSVSDYPNVENREVCAAKQIGGYFSMMFFIFSVVSPVLMALLYEATFEKSKVIPHFYLSKFSKEDWIVMLLCGFIYAVVQLLCAWFVGPELVCLLAAGFALVGYYVFQQCRVHGRQMNGRPNFGKRKFAIPFILLIAVLCIVRLIPGVEEALEGDGNEDAEAWLNPSILSVKYLDYSFNRHFGWLSHSGMAVLVVSLVTPFVTPYFDYEKAMAERKLRERKEPQPLYTSMRGLEEMSKNENQRSSLHKTAKTKKTKKRILAEMDATIGQKRVWVLREAFIKSIGEALPVMVSIGSYASIAKIMAGFNMTQTIAVGIVDLLDGLGRSGGQALYAFFIPIIGMLGSGLTGSTTTSNFLFGQLQVQTAIDLDLVGNNYNSVWEIAGDQIFGSTTGEIISPMNAVFSTLLLASRFKESVLMNRLILMAFIWGICCSFVSMIFIVPRGFIN